MDGLKLLDADRFDAVFTDIGMPGMSGWEFARFIRVRDAKIPIAVITGWGEAVNSAEQKEAQVNWVLTKPFSADRITDLAAEVSKFRTNGSMNFPIAASGATHVHASPSPSMPPEIRPF